MSKNSLYAVLAAAGLFALAPAPASAFHGNLLRCAPTLGKTATVSLKPGLTCTDAKNKIAVALSAKTGNQVDNCTGNAGAPWLAWQTGGIQKVAAGDISGPGKGLDIALKGLTFGSCNFTGDPNSYTAYAAGKFQVFSGANKVKGGGGAVFARVAGDTATTSADALGIVTKGFGAGTLLETQIGLNLAGTTACGATTCNNLILACNTGAICPPDVFDPNAHTGDTAVTTLDLISIPSSHVDISIPSNDDCTAAGAPIKCCTGLSTGTC